MNAFLDEGDKPAIAFVVRANCNGVHDNLIVQKEYRDASVGFAGRHSG